MDANTRDSIKAEISKLETSLYSLSPREAENSIFKILNPLLSYEGLEVIHTGGPGDNGIDFLVTGKGQVSGIQYKHYPTPDRKADASVLRSAIGSAAINNLDKIILLTNSGFTEQATNIATKKYPFSIELLDLNQLRNWAYSIDANYNDTEVSRVLRDFTQRIIQLIHKDPRVLDKIEWRDLERVTAELFEGIGFKVELTPSSKDGGKDVVLECVIQGATLSFIVEVKHWRSGQRVGQNYLKDFVQVVAKEKRQGGLFLSSYGYVDNVTESLTEIERTKVKIGGEEKIISLCQTYLKRKSGLWHKTQSLPEILFDQTT